jgi:hypothetical protein
MGKNTQDALGSRNIRDIILFNAGEKIIFIEF